MPNTPTIQAALHELNKQMNDHCLKDIIINGNIGLLRDGNPMEYTEKEWNAIMDYLKENINIEIIARVNQLEEYGIILD